MVSALPRYGLTVIFGPAVVLLGVGVVEANPDGGSVTRGDATIAKSGKVVEVTQTSKKAAIDWQTFSIGVDEIVRFKQPSAKSVILNRVTGSEASTILGRLQANGRVVLSNPNGISIGSKARIDVAGLVATTARLADRDLNAGLTDDVFRFENAPPGSFVINRGTVTVAEGGLAALVAPWVANEGIITARLGQVTLASGDAFTVDFYGDGLLGLAVDEQLVGALGVPPDGLEARLNQSGRITADGGFVALEVADARGIVDQVINMDGIVQARAVSQDGGQILLHGADSGTITVAGTLDASGRGEDQRGGQILVLGDDIRLADTSRLDVGGELLAGSVTIAGGIGPEGFLPARMIARDPAATLRIDTNSTGDPGELFELEAAPSSLAAGISGDLDLLQDFVGTLLPNAGIDVRTDAVPLADDLPPTAGVITVVGQFAAFAPDNVLGLYDRNDPDNRFTLLGRGTTVGDQVTYQVVEGDDGAEVFVNGQSVGKLAEADFGFFIDSSANDRGGLLFSDPGLNDRAFAALGNFPLDGNRVSRDDSTPEPVRDRLVGANNRLQAWEDVPPASGVVGAIRRSADVDDLIVMNIGGASATMVSAEVAVTPVIGRRVSPPPPPPPTNPVGPAGGGGGSNGGSVSPTGGGGGSNGGGDSPTGGTAIPPSILPGDSAIDSNNGSDADGLAPETELASADQCNSWRVDSAVSDAAVARCFAAVALDAISAHARTSFAALESALDNPSPITRAHAVNELGEIGAYLSAAVPVLLEALVTDDGRVARLAERVLRDADSFAQDVVPALGEATRDADDRVVRNAAIALGDLGAYATMALPVLDDTLDHADVAARFNAAEGIAKVDNDMRETTLALARVAAEGDTLGQLEDALGEDRSPFRARAVGTLAAVSDDTRDAAAATMPALGSADPGERATAVRTLGELDAIAGAALPVLIQAASLPESQALRASLARSGAALPLDAEVIRPLLQALNDRDPEVRSAAAAALENLAATASRSSAELARLPLEDLIVRRLAGRAEKTLAGFAPIVLPALQPAVADEDVRVRGSVVTALGHLGKAAEPAVPLLVAALASPESDTHRSAAQALGRIGTTPGAVVPALADRLFDPDPRVACEAGRALGLFGDAARSVAPKLLAAAEADESGSGFCAGVALFAVDSSLARDFWPPELAELGAQLEVESLLESIKGPAPMPRQIDLPVGPSAVAALPALVQALATAPAEDRQALGELLVTVADEVHNQVPWLALELAKGDAASRATAVRLLGRLATGTNEAVPGLVAGLDHPDQSVRFAMVRTLSLIAAQTTAATQALLTVALEDESSTVRADAAASFNQLTAVQARTSLGPALVAEAPLGRAGQTLVRIDQRL